ncbi:ABC transporter ATP-binding protein [uncultured Deefgea sp.]|uniref:ABC transporter ATP-binding protein n=1 Tax=uncultured Deefgea sp. TaxID=1304914 RepID=UPI00259738E9|nr:ABC transporter ATP-binding protein [uncultured Deefgea sp.]
MSVQPTSMQLQQVSIAQADRRLISDLSLHIQPGEVWLVLGENGCGKSTLLSTMAGWHALAAGTVALQGLPWMDWPHGERAKMLAWQTQQDECPFPLTVLEKVLTGRHPHLSRFAWESAADVALAQAQLARLDLSLLAARDLATLSGGERRRVALATALTQDAPLLLLDEPLSQLDLRHQQQALQVLSEEQAKGKAIVMVTHDPNHAHFFAAEHCRVLLLFGDGRWLAGPRAEVLTADHLTALYHHPIIEITTPDRAWFIPR